MSNICSNSGMMVFHNIFTKMLFWPNTKSHSKMQTFSYLSTKARPASVVKMGKLHPPLFHPATLRDMVPVSSERFHFSLLFFLPVSLPVFLQMFLVLYRIIFLFCFYMFVTSVLFYISKNKDTLLSFQLVHTLEHFLDSIHLKHD